MKKKKCKKDNNKTLKIVAGSLIGIMALGVAAALLVKFDVFNIQKQEYTSTAHIVSILENDETKALLDEAKLKKENVDYDYLIDNYSKENTMLYSTLNDKYNIVLNLKNELISYENSLDSIRFYVYEEKINSDKYLQASGERNYFDASYVSKADHDESLALLNSNKDMFTEAYFDVMISQHMINKDETIDVYETVSYNDLEITKVIHTYESIVDEQSVIETGIQYYIHGNFNIQDKYHIKKDTYDTLSKKIEFTEILNKRLAIDE